MVKRDADKLRAPASSWVGTEEQFRVLWWILSVIIILNLFDAIFTINWIERGEANEANPLMDLIIAQPVLFVCVKTTLVGLGCYLLWGRHRRPIAVVGIILAFVVYYAILLHHLRAVKLEPIIALLANMN